MDGEALVLVDALVARARTGDLEALSSVYRAYSTAVYNLARRICGNEADAEDVVQETFLEVCRSIGMFRGEGSLWSWVRQVAVSKALMHLRRLRQRNHYSLNGDSPLQADGFGFANGVHKSQPELAGSVDLEAALDRLPSVTRVVLWLHDVEGYTHREIGQMMGKSSSFSKSQLSRAHRRLREWLG